jgi:hypothetical protein
VTRYLSADEIRYIHRQTILDHGHPASVVDSGKLEAAAARPTASASGQDIHPKRLLRCSSP